MHLLILTLKYFVILRQEMRKKKKTVAINVLAVYHFADF